MESHQGFRYRSSCDAQRQMAELALTPLRLRADSPPGQWVDEPDGATYEGVQDQARAGRRLGPGGPPAVPPEPERRPARVPRGRATGIQQEVWLDRVHTDYIAPVDPDGIGVWGAEELAL
jgi:hypothetical protein